MNSADICRANRWGPGSILEGDEGNGPERIMITAVGEEHILARELHDDGLERTWSLEFRDWKQVGQLPGGI